MSIPKKLLTAAFALICTLCLAAVLFFVPALSSSAAESEAPQLIDKTALAYFDFDVQTGEFKGLTTEGVKKVGQKPAKVVIPDSIKSIAAGGADGVDGVTVNALFKAATPYIVEIEFGNASNIESVGECAFAGLSSLTKINLGAAETLSSIGAGAFRGCSSLESLSLSTPKVTEIPANFARGCSSLSLVTLTDSVMGIGNSAFEGCALLNAFNFPTGLKTIGNSSFAACEKLSAIEVPSTVTSIGENAFAGCSALAEATLPDSLTTLSNGIFQNCSKLVKLNAVDGGTNCNLPSSVKTIGNRAFSGCISLKDVTIPASVEKIGVESFYSCQAIDVINYYAACAVAEGANPFDMPAEAYAESARGEGVTVNIGSADAKVTQLPSRLFCAVDDVSVAGHKGITTVNFVNVELVGGEGENGWGYSVFRDCTSLTTVNFTAGKCTIPVIKQDAFNGCTSLVNITNLDKIGLATIGERAFENCSALFHVTIGEGVTEIKNEAFSGCERLIEVVNLSHLSISNDEINRGKHGAVAQNALAVYTTEQTQIARPDSKGFVFFSQSGSPYLLGYVGEGGDIDLPADYNSKSYQIYKKAFYKNSDVTEINMGSSKVTHIGASAFADCTALKKITFSSELAEVGNTALQGCTSLTNVTFSTNCTLRKISAGMFSGCDKLVSIDLPDSVGTIDTEAFKNCAALTTVNFTTNSQKPSKLERIAGSAFEGCASLGVMALPDTVKAVDQNAFKNCIALSVVYLPSDTADKKVTYGAGAFDGCSPDLLIISKNKAQYDLDVAKDTLKESAVKSHITYLVKLNLFYADGTDGGLHEDYRLFGRDNGAGYVQDGLRWIWTPSMPKQTGYSVSRWFSDKNYEHEVDFNGLSAMLKESGRSKVDLYARYIEQPDLQPKLGSSSPSYDESMSWEIEQIIKNCFTSNSGSIDDASNFKTYFRCNIPTHYFVNGDRDNAWSWDSTTGRVNQAGKYKLIIELEAGTYGSWANQIELDFEIRPKEIDISDKVKWEPDGSNTSLQPIESAGAKTLYFYGDDVPYLEQQDGKTPTKTVDVINSYVVFADKDISIHLNFSSQYGSVMEDSYINNTGREAGSYTSNVKLRPANNYIFKYEVTPTPDALKPYGLSFRRETDGTMTVSKRWYIAISSANHLVAAEGGDYTIKSGVLWNYLDNSAAVPERPALSRLNDYASELITFTLKFNGAIVGNAEKLPIGPKAESLFERYVNSSMPAGDYELTFYILPKTDGGSVVTGNPNGQKFTFSVGKASLRQQEVSDITDRKLTDITVPFNGELRFIPTSNISLLDSDNPSRPQVKRVGVWQNSEFDKYYTNFEISYYVKSGAKSSFAGDPDPLVYQPLSDYPDKAEGEIPVAIGTYTVFYKISAPNFSTVIKGRYELNVTHTLTLDKFVVQPIEFSGGSIIDRVIMQLSDKTLDCYDIFTLREEDKSTPQDLFARYGKDTYIGLGEHKVFIRIKDAKSKYIKWDDAISDDNFITIIQRKYLVVKFNIVATQNREITPLSVNRWEYGEFTREVNKPEWVLQFSDDYTKYSFVLTSATDSDETYYFYGDPDKALAENQLGFDKAPAGQYVLTAYAPADDASGIYAFSKECNVTVDKASLRFTSAPFIDSWNYGNYKAENVAPEFVLGGLGSQVKNDIKVKYCTESEYKKPQPDLRDVASLLDTEKQLPSGTYYLVYSLDECDNFKDWSYGVRFRVLRAENYWDVTPVIHDWVYGEYGDSTEKINLKPHFGDVTKVKLQYKNSDSLSGWVDSIEALTGFDTITGELNVGTYEFRAVVPVSNNYNSLTFQTTFNVTKTINGWKTVPGVKGWSEGRFTNENKPFAVAKFGTVKYTVTDDNGNEYDVNKLGSLKIGNYKLTATVDGNDNYEVLTSEVYFSVVEDSVGMTGLMVATIIFSVIALGLAAAGVTLLVLRNRKAEIEFRKAVKNELRRK